jgi:hypothetical protein
MNADYYLKILRTRLTNNDKVNSVVRDIILLDMSKALSEQFEEKNEQYCKETSILLNTISFEEVDSQLIDNQKELVNNLSKEIEHIQIKRDTLHDLMSIFSKLN